MHRVLIVAPRPELAAFCCADFARELEARAGVQAVTAGSVAATALATDAGTLAAVAPAPWLFGVDTIVWLRFTPSVYLRDWIAGIVDQLLNGSAAAQRRRYRARPRDVLRAVLTYVLSPPIDPRDIAARQPSVRVVELNSPAQARFWLHINEVRRREAARSH